MMMPTAILYARVSTRGQARNGYSLPQQIEALRGWAECEGYEVLEVVEDAGYSGASFERPGLDRVRDLVAAGGVDVVIAQDRDRLAREPAYVYLLKQELAEHGTKLKALNDRGDDSPEGELTDGILDQLAKFERAKTAERSRRGKTRKVREGKVVKGPRPPYGFRYTEEGVGLAVEPTTMRVVARIVEMLGRKGESLGAVARRLNGEGIPSPGDGDWHKPRIRALVKDDLYRALDVEEVAESGLVPPDIVRALDPEHHYGLWIWGRNAQTKVAVPVPLSDPAPPREVADAARERVGDRQRRPASRIGQRFWQLGGGIARCGECGSVLSPRSRPRPKSKTGKTDHWYLCRQGTGDGSRKCTHNRCYRAAELEDTVWQAVYGLLVEPERLLRKYDEWVEHERRKMRRDPDREARDLAARLQRLERRKGGYLDLAADGDMSREELRAKLADLDEERKEFEKALKQVQARKDSLRDARRRQAAVRYLVGRLGDVYLMCASFEDRRRLYQALGLRADVDKDGTIRLSGFFERDLRDVMQDQPDTLSPPPKPLEGSKVVAATPYPSQLSG